MTTSRACLVAALGGFLLALFVALWLFMAVFMGTSYGSMLVALEMVGIAAVAAGFL